MDDLPTSVARYLQTVAFDERAVAYLHVDAGLKLLSAGGQLADYGLAKLKPSEPVTARAAFLEGLLPPPENPCLLPSMEVATGRVADIHLLTETDTTWVILLDATAARDAARRMQQRAYDMTLLREREQQLNRKLEAANADLVEAHARIQAQAAELAAWAKTLEERVAAQVEEIGRIGRLKRFLAPALAEMIVSSGDDRLLQSHRRDIAALFCDLRGFTAFTEVAEPEEVMELLRDYHGAVVPLIQACEGTLDRFVGDGMVVYFNDPLPCPNPAERAVRLAIQMRDAVAVMTAAWARRGFQIGFGVGAAQGFATLGQIGFQERLDYSAIGTVINTAARLCDAAKDGQILVTSRIAQAVAETADTRELGPISFRGLSRPLAVWNVAGLKGAVPAAAAAEPTPEPRPALAPEPRVYTGPKLASL
jgi:class 3 adenylate cyclase